MSVLTVATPADVDRLSVMLTGAFADDPLSLWMIPSSGYPGRLDHLFQFLLIDGVARGVVDVASSTSGSEPVGAAIWLKPGQWKVPPATQVRHAGRIVRAGGTRLLRMLGRLGDLERKHPHGPDHWYLQVLGVAPRHQGQGVGSALLRHRIDQFDQAKIPAYLESSNERNLPLYQRHGFAVTEELSFRKGPTQWLMWREPSASTSAG